MEFGSKFVYVGVDAFETVQNIEEKKKVGVKEVARTSRNMMQRCNDGQTCLLDILDTAGVFVFEVGGVVVISLMGLVVLIQNIWHIHEW